jgi:hypothetical protein
MVCFWTPFLMLYFSTPLLLEGAFGMMNNVKWLGEISNAIFYHAPAINVNVMQM